MSNGITKQWVVIIGSVSIWAKCYGPFVSYDAAIEWLRANQFTPSECGVFPVTSQNGITLTGQP